MKKVYLVLLSALFIATGATAQKAQSVTNVKQAQTRILQLQKAGKTIDESTLRANGLNPIGKVANKIGTPVARNGVKVKKAEGEFAITWPDASTIITEQPEGTLHAADFRSGNYTYAFWGYLYSGTYSNGIGTYVVADDAIYLKNPFNGYSTDTWLKLDKVDDENYVAHLPQVIYVANDDENDTTYVYYAARVKYDAESLYVADSTSQDVAFTYKDGVLTQADSTVDDTYGDPLYGFSLTNTDFDLYGYVDNGIKIEPNNLSKAELPANAEIKQYQLTNTHHDILTYPDYPEYNDVDTTATNSLVKVAFDGDDIYINNPATGADDSWIKGTIADGKATFLPQYIGADEEDGYHLWFLPATFEIATDSSDYYGYIEEYRHFIQADKIELTVNDEKSVITAPENSSLIINTAPNRIYYIATYDEPVFKAWEEKAAAPADPTINSVAEYYNSYGYAYVNFNLTNVDADGTLLDVNKVYYNVFLSDDPETPFALTADEGYEYFSNPDSVNIPYSYSDGWDVYASGTAHTVYFYFDTTDLDSIGVQEFYTGGGETNSSNVVWYNLIAAREAAGISTVEGNNSGVKSVAYYDLSGRQVSAPKQSGLYIKETTYADGTKKGSKILRK